MALLGAAALASAMPAIALFFWRWLDGGGKSRADANTRGQNS
jgi:hypothetical protein